MKEGKTCPGLVFSYYFLKVVLAEGTPGKKATLGLEIFICLTKKAINLHDDIYDAFRLCIVSICSKTTFKKNFLL